MPEYQGTEIAIVGMAGRFPKSRNLDEFWKRLCDGEELITHFETSRLEATGVDASVIQDPQFIKAASHLDRMEYFDAAFFGITPKTAELMDPQHRIFLECAWEALEHAGYDPEQYDGLTGIYAGAAMNSYFATHIAGNARFHTKDLMPVLFANDKDYMTSRVAYLFNLKGPSLSVQAACATSLTALHLGCQSLLNEECDMVLAGGVSVPVHLRHGYYYNEGGISSATGHCRTFDAQADGTVFGAGAGVVVMKRLEDALSQGDTIHSVVLGSAINNDGASKAGYTALSVDGEASVIAEALAVADVESQSIQYVECHATGSALGDPIELTALQRVFQHHNKQSAPCVVGSTKSNVGHLDAASGMAGLLKTICAMKDGKLPPTLHFETPNPNFDWSNSAFRVNTTLSDWPDHSTPRRAGVSAFGIGGTNAHVVLEEPPLAETSEATRSHQLILLSAKTSSALDQITLNLQDHVELRPDSNLADIAYTLHIGRKPFAYRRALVIANGEALPLALLQEKYDSSEVNSGARPVGWVFSLQNQLPLTLIQFLSAKEPAFQEALEACRVLSEVPLPMLSPKLQCFIGHYALARLWESWGVEPAFIINQGSLEVLAACLAEVMPLGDAIALMQTNKAPDGFSNRLSPPKIRMLSSKKNTWLTPEQATDPAYWTTLEAIQTTPFQLEVDSEVDSEVDNFLQTRHPSFLCFAPQPDSEPLSSTKETPLSQYGPVFFSWSPDPSLAVSMEQLLRTTGRLWLEGTPIDAQRFYRGQSRCRVPLPTYPFEGKRFWIDPPKGSETSHMAETTDSESKDVSKDDSKGLSKGLSKQALERLMKEVWKDNLGIEEIQSNDDFFELGGDSFLASQVVGDLTHRLGRVIPLENVIGYQTLEECVEGLHDWIQQQDQKAA